MELINFSTISLGVIFIFMNLMFFASLIFKRNDIADFAWGIGFIVVAFLNFILSKDFQQTKMILTFLVFLWGLRLTIYITIRN
ncbi:MAG TPA: DUF1295 domain-containing protein, partial [Patescibacteria group bacterium]|nr:DUF1295 domain-containing protein [Patescibacteria group bacterium]